MKKIISFLLAAILSLSICVCAFAGDWSDPFETGTLNCERYRIPAIITLNDGSVLAAADLRYDHGSDAPGNLDTLVASSSDLKTWDYNVVNYFPDCSDLKNDSDSASFNDSAIIQSKNTGRIFIASSAFPSGYGYAKSKTGTGYVKDSDGNLRLALTAKKNNTNISNYECYIGEFKDGFAPVIGSDKNYTVDEEFYLYLNGKPIYTTKVNTDEKIQQNVFFEASDYHIFPTCYLWSRYSDDNGKTWSKPLIISPFVKSEKESFMGICPGRGAVTTVNGNERVIFAVYDNSTGCERASTVYTDDNGATWHRGERLTHKAGLRKTSESQIINCPDGSLRIFTRTETDLVGTGVSYDGGVTWSRIKGDKNLECTKNCMVSFINTDKVINSKSVVLGSFACGGNDRKDGVIVTGLMDSEGNIEWIKKYHINSGFFAYSCLTELADGTFACLYEDEAAHISLKVFNMDGDGTLKAVDGSDIEYTSKPGFFEKLWLKILRFLRVLIDFPALVK